MENLIILSVKHLRILQIISKKMLTFLKLSFIIISEVGKENTEEEKKMNELKKAMQELGFRAGTVVTVRAASVGRLLVSVNGEAFGVWDSDKNTFVD